MLRSRLDCGFFVRTATWLASLAPLALSQELAPGTRGLETAQLSAPASVLAAGTSCQSSWIPTFGGIPGPDGNVWALDVFDDGTGPALYVGGFIANAGGVAANRIAKWDGTSWSALGSGVQGSAVYALTVFDDGSGPALYAGGSFTSADGVTANNVAKWDGTSWSALGSGMNGIVFALTAFDDGSGPALYAGGSFTSASGVSASRIAKWSGASWSALGSGMSSFGKVEDLAVFDDGGGPALYAGGSFTSAGGVAANNVAKWDGSSWSALRSGTDGAVYALKEFDDGSGPALYVGGQFTGAGGAAASYIARWNGATWSAVGSGLNGPVRALAWFDDGSGSALHAGGFFSAGGVAAAQAAKWDGTSWSALGSGMSNTVLSLSAFDDGSGPALYAGGSFTSAGGVPASHIAKWDGTSMSGLGSGMSGVVFALTELDDGSGVALYAGGVFQGAGGVAASNVAKWDGTSWSALGSGTTDGFFHALTSFDDGGGLALFAAGSFTSAGGVAASNIAKWNGTSWSALGSGLSDGAFAVTAFDDGSGSALYAGGEFAISPAGDSFVAKWGCPAISSLPGCAGNPATLEALTASAPLGAPLPLRISGSAAVSGVGVVAYGASGVDGSGCGLLVPGFGELLLALAPPPKTLTSGILAGGVCDLSPLVPAIPSLSGVIAYLQGAAVDFALPQPIELTNALAVTLGP